MSGELSAGQKILLRRDKKRLIFFFRRTQRKWDCGLACQSPGKVGHSDQRAESCHLDSTQTNSTPRYRLWRRRQLQACGLRQKRTVDLPVVEPVVRLIRLRIDDFIEFAGSEIDGAETGIAAANPPSPRSEPKRPDLFRHWPGRAFPGLDIQPMN
jgi:hypothetical protein